MRTWRKTMGTWMFIIFRKIHELPSLRSITGGIDPLEVFLGLTFFFFLRAWKSATIDDRGQKIVVRHPFRNDIHLIHPSDGNLNQHHENKTRRRRCAIYRSSTFSHCSSLTSNLSPNVIIDCKRRNDDSQYYLYHSLCILDWKVHSLEQIRAYQQAEIPFVLQNHPEV